MVAPVDVAVETVVVAPVDVAVEAVEAKKVATWVLVKAEEEEANLEEVVKVEEEEANLEEVVKVEVEWVEEVTAEGERGDAVTVEVEEREGVQTEEAVTEGEARANGVMQEAMIRHILLFRHSQATTTEYIGLCSVYNLDRMYMVVQTHYRVPGSLQLHLH